MAYAGADLSTVDANPTVYSYGDSSTLDAITQIGNVAAQWGTAIASAVSGNSQSVVVPAGVQPMASGTVMSQSTFASKSGILLLLAAAVILFLVLREE